VSNTNSVVRVYDYAETICGENGKRHFSTASPECVTFSVGPVLSHLDNGRTVNLIDGCPGARNPEFPTEDTTRLLL
jgi:hypothetical protein